MEGLLSTGSTPSSLKRHKIYYLCKCLLLSAVHIVCVNVPAIDGMSAFHYIIMHFITLFILGDKTTSQSLFILRYTKDYYRTS